VCEILRMAGRGRDMILDADQTDRLREAMQTFDQALLHHVQAASSMHDFKVLVAGDGRTSTSMSDLRRDRRGRGAGR